MTQRERKILVEFMRLVIDNICPPVSEYPGFINVSGPGSRTYMEFLADEMEKGENDGK